MQIYIPTIGTKLRLTEDWSFEVEKERRNWEIVEALKGYGVQPRLEFAYKMWNGEDYNDEFYPMVLPAGTVLTIDRIYIRKGVGEYDSITFNLGDCPDLRFEIKRRGGQFVGRRRFWVKLDDANRIVCDILPAEDAA